MLDYGVKVRLFVCVKQFFVTARHADYVLCVMSYGKSESHIRCDVAGEKRNNRVGAGRIVCSQIFADKAHIVIAEIRG